MESKEEAEIDRYVLGIMNREDFEFLADFAEQIYERYGKESCLGARLLHSNTKLLDDLANLDCKGIPCESCILSAGNYLSIYKEVINESNNKHK